MEMYKKISLITDSDDAGDVIDELTDRFGDVPKVVDRLVNVSLARALAERARISRVEAKDGRLIFTPERPRLDLWSDVFARFRGMSFLGVGSPSVVYRLGKGEDAASAAKDILTAYVNAMTEAEQEA